MNKHTWLVAALFASLAVNLLFVGLMVGQHIFGPRSGRPHFEWMTGDIGADVRRQMGADMREHMQETRPARKALRGAQRRLHRLIAEDEYDEAAVRAALSEIRQASTSLQATLHEQMISTLSKLAPEDRAQVLRMLSRGPDQMPGRRHDRRRFGVPDGRLHEEPQPEAN